jgi:uncharacterized membrane protein
VLAALGSTDFIYRVVFLLHIFSAIVAFAPYFVWPVLNVQTRKRGASVPSDIAGQAAVNQVVVHGPALVATGVFGLLMVVLAEGDVFEFSQLWISLAFLLWFAMLGVLFGLLVPAERKAAGGAPDAGKRVAMFGGITHLLLLLMLVVMIWKPGL